MSRAERRYMDLGAIFDAHVQAEFGPIGLAGFFCNGEIGPVGQKNFLHGYTASLAMFVQK